MNSVWFNHGLASSIMEDNDILNQTPCVVTDLITGKIELTTLVENMAQVLTHAESENRLKGMRFYTKILKELPKTFLNDMELLFISKFYTDRLKDHHSITPLVIEGTLALIEMTNYRITYTTDFLASLFREVSCQTQLRQDRYNIYLIFQKLMEKDVECESNFLNIYYMFMKGVNTELKENTCYVAQTNYESVTFINIDTKEGAEIILRQNA